MSYPRPISDAEFNSHVNLLAAYVDQPQYNRNLQLGDQDYTQFNNAAVFFRNRAWSSSEIPWSSLWTTNSRGFREPLIDQYVQTVYGTNYQHTGDYEAGSDFIGNFLRSNTRFAGGPRPTTPNPVIPPSYFNTPNTNYYQSSGGKLHSLWHQNQLRKSPYPKIKIKTEIPVGNLLASFLSK